MIRALFYLCFLAGFVYFGTTVQLGSRTLFGHAANIWNAEETQEMVDGVKEKSAPVVEKVARGARAGWNEVTRGEDKPAVGTDDGSPVGTATPPAEAPRSGAGHPDADTQRPAPPAKAPVRAAPRSPSSPGTSAPATAGAPS